MARFWQDQVKPLFAYISQSSESSFTYLKIDDATGSSIPLPTEYEKTEIEKEDDKVDLDLPSSSLKPLRVISQQHMSAWSSRIFTLCLLLNMTCLVIIMFMLNRHSSHSQSTPTPHSEPTGEEFGSCGEDGDIDAARAAGCVFDPASLIWTKPECYDQDLVDSFLGRTDWRLYTNKTLLPEYEIPYDEWLRGEHPIVYAPRKFHVVHCYYMWEKLHKAYLTGAPMDSEVAQLHHTRHCSKALLNDYLGEDTCAMGARCPTHAGTTWTSCGYYK